MVLKTKYVVNLFSKKEQQCTKKKYRKILVVASVLLLRL
ncbi:protein of unknown function [Chryseobacterium sp. JV274]|nr:protein of unknown function [Chryseobacterium sp. JV274]